jgi:enamine deaminase RidA (YjgF/YER057c/UK114 family)
MDITRFHVGEKLSEIAIHNGTIYLAGQVPEDDTQSIEGQTTEVLGHIDRLLAEAGSDSSRILMCQIFLVDGADFDGMNASWMRWVAPGASPPRATVVVAGLAKPWWRVEMVVTAAAR